MPSDLKNTKVLVTGCAGFIASFVTEKLLASGAKVYGIDNLSTGSIDNMKGFIKNPNFNFYKNDICNEKILKTLVKKTDIVYHAAVRGLGVSVSNPLLEEKVNIQATLMLLEILRKSKIKRFVYASSASVYGNPKRVPEKESDPTFPLSPYGVSKLAAERYCIAYNNLFKIPLVCLRYFNTYGPRQRKDSVYGGVVSIFINCALENKPFPIYGDGKQTRDFTYIDDTVSATMTAFIAPDLLGKTINISGGKEYSILFLAKKIKEISGKKSLPIQYVQKRAIDNVERRFGDIYLARKLFQYVPSTLLDAGLKKTLQWNRNFYFGSF